MRAVLVCAFFILAAVTVAHAQSLQEQTICASQAGKAYRADYVAPVPGMKLETSNFQSHYNTKLNKCLMLTNQIIEYSGQTTMTAQLSDVIERHVFADYSLNMKNNIMVCQLTPTLDKTMNCSSRDEFNSFVAKYMEQ
jgi:hypothetical protein